MSALRVFLLMCLSILWLPAGSAAEDERIENTIRLRQAIRSTGMEPGPNVDRKLAAMSNHEIERLLNEHESIGYSGNPMVVILGAVLLLILVVFLLVTVIE